MSIKNTPLVKPPKKVLPGQVVSVPHDSLQAYITASRSEDMVAQMKEMIRQRTLEASGAKEEPKKINPNEYPALKMRLSELEGLWEIKFGESWVSAQELIETEDPDFWDVAALRLNSMNRIEKFSNHESFSIYYRLCR